MQTPKARAGTLEVPQRRSPATQHTPGQLKTPRSDLDFLSFSPNSVSKIPKTRSPKMTERKLPRSPITEHTKLESRQRESKLQEELKTANLCIAELRGKLFPMEFQLQSVSKKNEELNLRINENLPIERKSQFAVEHNELEYSLAELKERVLERETELQNVIEENNALKMELGRMEIENDRRNDEIVASAKAAEREALVKLGLATEEADKINKKVARLTEQLDAAEYSYSEMEAEMRRLKVQADQWRKAGEAATAMISSGNNGKFVERTGSLDSSYNKIAGKRGSPYLDNTDDESPKRKNTNTLKKLGVLWKKSH